MRRYDDRLATHGLRTVIVVRLTLFLLPPAHWLLGLSQVRFVPFVLGTAIGFLPGIALLTYVVVFLGNNFGELLKDRPPGFFLGLAVVVVVFIRLRRRWQKRRDEAEPPDTAVAPLDEA